ncbi:NAD(P)/FAD-dependent oxidoreductase [Desulfurella sp.]|uniref:NAD(P)/FAD-dependent oxidoreductase n=1 Tax=Desulfurella sp. TaxID=1962857 RepID=UPI003D137A4D
MTEFFDVVIIGAGPAGITCALELARNNKKVLVLEQDSQVGGISKTINYKQNRIDIGGHRFFSKSEWVKRWWMELLEPCTLEEAYIKDKCMLKRDRLSRIYFEKKFYDYPLKLNFNTALNIGFFRGISFLKDYIKARIDPIKPEKNLEDFFINRFGVGLYETFFRDYTQKVWGVSCKNISKEWGSQRIKSLDISKAILHAFKSLFLKNSASATTLIEEFDYPKLGPGQLWETAIQKAIDSGAKLKLNAKALYFEKIGDRIDSLTFLDTTTSEVDAVKSDYFVSTMPIKDLALGIRPEIEEDVFNIATNLQYRDFISIGLLYKKLAIQSKNYRKEAGACRIPDNWIYVQEPNVKMGRIQLFNNWSPFMIADINTVWLGLEYFCNEGDKLWQASNKELIELGLGELEKIGIAKKFDFIDGTVIRQKKAYPAYFGTYEKFDLVKNYFNKFENLFLIGRNGMHRYNNQDHSMLTAKEAVNCILSGKLDKSAIWDINVDDDYHEEN